ncbi:MAG: hypothetical protein D6816_18605 [Bacteroidetes bacterium]|nr:MAG: hypothetical protein D6816_18605 [Bacteroidota bacterium]
MRWSDFTGQVGEPLFKLRELLLALKALNHFGSFQGKMRAGLHPPPVQKTVMQGFGNKSLRLNGSRGQLFYQRAHPGTPPQGSTASRALERAGDCHNQAAATDAKLQPLSAKPNAPALNSAS